jgi:hypothetical protein
MSATLRFRPTLFMGSTLVKRGRRYAIRVAIRYREIGSKCWFEGWAENISDSGVLFRTSQLLPLQTPVEMRFTLPMETVLGKSLAEIACWGNVMRVSPTEGADTIPALAASIRRYHFVRRHDAGQSFGR